jgi:hypothetical protein
VGKCQRVLISLGLRGDRAAYYCSNGGGLVRLGLIRGLSEIDAYTDW